MTHHQLWPRPYTLCSSTIVSYVKSLYFIGVYIFMLMLVHEFRSTAKFLCHVEIYIIPPNYLTIVWRCGHWSVIICEWRQKVQLTRKKRKTCIFGNLCFQSNVCMNLRPHKYVYKHDCTKCILHEFKWF